MSSNPPKIVAINHDDYHAKHVGRTDRGEQFFLTNPFEPAGTGVGCEFIALYVFDSKGVLIEAKIDQLGPRKAMDEQEARELYDHRLEELGDISFERIEVVPFKVERFGVTFGLVLREPENEDDEWAVEIQPGNYMAFFEPFDSGDYDT